MAKLFVLLFAAPKPVAATQLMEICQFDEATLQRELGVLASAIKPLGLKLIRHNESYQLATCSEFASDIAQLKGRQDETLSPVGLEVLAIVAYRQPITRDQIDEIRGVGSEQTIKMLLSRKLIVPADRKLDHQIAYKTTADFLRHIGLNHINKLPKLTTHATNHHST